jgi:ferredoxin
MADAGKNGAPAERAIEVIVEADTCYLTGYCLRTHPQLFEERDGVAVPRVSQVSAGDEELQAAARDAEALCPTGAIVIQ